MKQTVLLFGLLITALLILFQLGKFQFVESSGQMEISIAVLALVFFFLGLYFQKKWTNQALGSKHDRLDHDALKQIGLSDREKDVLRELVGGLSNKEIGEKLFVSESTVKSHVSNIYAKLGVNRRSQAILRVKQLEIVEK